MDIFGHNFKLTIRDGNGTQQTSIKGGFVTLLIYILISMNIVKKSQKMSGGNFENIMKSEDAVAIEAKD